MAESGTWNLAKTAGLLDESHELILSSRRVLERSCILKHRTLIDIGHSHLRLSETAGRFPSGPARFETSTHETEINWRLDSAA